MEFSQPYELMRMDHVGTRLDHYMELLDMWGLGVEVLLGKYYLDEEDKERLKILQGAVHLLSQRITNSNGTGYDETEMRRTVNSLPKDAKEII